MLKHLLSDSKNIKESLRYITNYIRNKSIESNKINNIIYLKEVGEAAWNFISALYDTGWDSLVSEEYNHSFP